MIFSLKNKLTKISVLLMAVTAPFAANASNHTQQVSEMYDFPFMQNMYNSSVTLVRKRNDLKAIVSATGLDANAAYTAWWTLFNNPDKCYNGPGKCSVYDLWNEDAMPTSFYATGFVTGNDGVANVTIELSAGRPAEGSDVMFPGGLKRGNGMKAEVQVILRTHGAVIPGRLGEQTTTYMGGCDVNSCAETQMASFPPMN